MDLNYEWRCKDGEVKCYNVGNGEPVGNPGNCHGQTKPECSGSGFHIGIGSNGQPNRCGGPKSTMRNFVDMNTPEFKEKAFFGVAGGAGLGAIAYFIGRERKYDKKTRAVMVVGGILVGMFMGGLIVDNKHKKANQ